MYVDAPDKPVPRVPHTASYATATKPPPPRKTTLVVCACGLRHRHVRIATTPCPICGKTPVLVAESP